MSLGRHEARKWAVQFLYQRDFNPTETAEALELFWEEQKPSAKLKLFTEEIIRGVEAQRDELDAMLQKYAAHWDVNRMAAVDRNILRVALYEMLNCHEIPPVVSINEAVDLAKEFGEKDSGKFVNGLLDKIRQDISRPARTVSGSRDKIRTLES